MSDSMHWLAENNQGTSKYRASCDYCNEAKVRCSQEKPTCARCHKSQRECIYGLSRRSHRSANPPGVNIAKREKQQQKQQKQQQQQHRDQWQHPQRRQLMSPPSSNVTNSAEISGNQSPTDTGDTIHVTPWMSPVGFPDSLSLESEIDANLFSVVNTVLQDQSCGLDLGLSASDFSNTGLDFQSDLTMSTPPAESALIDDGTGSRTSWFITKLASTAVPLCARGFPLDVQLSHLKAALSFAEEGLRLKLTDCDDIEPLVISTLVCSIIKGFENSLDALNETGETNAESPALTPTQQPKFSWGALRIDDSTELALLKRHMWLVQFQRVKAVLQGMQDRIKGMKHEQMDQATAQQILVSNNMHMWLEQRAQVVRQKFMAATGDPTSMNESQSSSQRMSQLMMPQ
ncbi:hypothetical protein GGR57DRAFT_505862 [Xylariaceae sp. FL1272]|nr:hypothetical protein GGR57DRAFT_505862 [Xylariaceae sp. FL1272]